jgi:hypothetical protein
VLIYTMARWPGQALCYCHVGGMLQNGCGCEIVVSMRRALWNGLQRAYGKSLPEGTGLKLVYQDSDGDFILLQPDEPWSHFLSNARRVIISCR